MEELNLAQCLDRTPIEWIRLLVQVVIGVLVVLGNSLVIVSILVAKVLRHPRNFLVLSLALADLFVGLVLIPFKINSEENCYEWESGNALCHIWISGDIMLTTASILSLTAISIDRYFAIRKPLFHRVNFTRNKIYGLITVAWIAAFLLVIPYWWLVSSRSEAIIGNSTATPSICYEDSDTYSWSWHHLVGILVSFFLPLCILLFVNVSITRVLKRQQSKLNKVANAVVQYTDAAGVPASLTRYNFLQEKKGFIMTGIVFVCFVICWLPFFTLMLVQAVYSLSDQKLTVASWVYELFGLLGKFQSCANPFIYTMFSQDFRFAFKELLSCRCSTLSSQLRSDNATNCRTTSSTRS